MRAMVRQMLANRGILATLALLLALGPFLHGHFGSAHLTGFHLDGLDALEHLHSTGPLEQANPYDIESPAVGVAIAVSRFEEPGSPASDLALIDGLLTTLLASLTLALAATPAVLLCWRRVPAGAGPAHARPGAPPPALAPPALN
jgi:hypothetical protein